MKRSNDGDPKMYVKMLVYVFIALGLFVLAIMNAFFASVGLFFGEAIVDVDVFEDKYKYECTTVVNGVCTVFNTSAQLTPYTDLQTFQGDLNATMPLYINSTTVIFSLLALVFLFLALKSAGLFGKGSKVEKKDEY